MLEIPYEMYDVMNCESATVYMYCTYRMSLAKVMTDHLMFCLFVVRTLMHVLLCTSQIVYGSVTAITFVPGWGLVFFLPLFPSLRA
jgi:membrane-anchored glycerophosphoryl diester phosphodiesterase (GDPDase)